MRDDRKVSSSRGTQRDVTANCCVSLIEPAASCEACRELLCARELDRQKHRTVVVPLGRLRMGR
jgi:hypothetical protein